jgi:2-oxoglutarate ferredoxin oxidoreductase subunit alpha
LRPITLWPFPNKRIAELAEQIQGILTVEMNAGQMVEDVRLAVGGRCPVTFYGRMGGVIPLADEILPELEKLAAELKGGQEARNGD